MTQLADRQMISAWRNRVPDLALFGGVLAVYLLTGAYRFQSIDVVAAEAPAHALATRGSLDMSAVPHHYTPWYFEHEGGLFSDRFPGAILYIAPAYWIASVIGFQEFSYAPGVITACLAAALSVVIMGRVFRSLFDPRNATGATLFFAFGTGTWSVAANAPWSHTLDQLLIALLLLFLSKGQFGLAALANGMVITTRPVLAVAAAALGVALAVFQRSPRRIVQYGLLTLPGVAFLVIYNGILFDRWGPSNGHELGGDIHVRWSDIPLNLAGAFFSPTRGAFFYYPILIVVAFAGRQAWKAAADWEKAAAISGAIALVCQMSLNRYSGGDTFFGPRLLIEPLTLAAPFIARSAVQFAKQRGYRAVRWMLVAGIAIHGLGASASLFGSY